MATRSRTASEDPTKDSYSVAGQPFIVDKHYSLRKPIGQGAYGVVCSAINTKTQQKCAIKKITKGAHLFQSPIELKRTIREVRLLRHFDHENIIRIVDIMSARQKSSFDGLYMVFELMDTDLHQIIQSKQTLSDEHIQYFIYQVLRGLKYLHSADVMHRDLKPSNLLVDANCDLKICDFGLARKFAEHDQKFMTEYVATRWYRAPEIMLSWKEYGHGIDMWSVGCILGELLGRRPMFPGTDYMDQIRWILKIRGTPSHEDSEYIASDKAKAYIRALKSSPATSLKKIFKNASPHAIDLLDKMLQFAPQKRITVTAALRHPYLEQFHDPEDEPEYEGDKNFNFEFEKHSTLEILKDVLWEECQYHKARRQDSPDEKSGTNEMDCD